MNQAPRVVATATALTLLTGGALAAAAPLGAAEPTATTSARLVNDELVLARLDPRGLPIQARLVSRLSAPAGPQRTIHDPTATTDVQYLNQRGRPTVSGDGIEVTVGGSEPTLVLTEGVIGTILPLALHAEYQLDGQVVGPDSVIGRSGELAVTYTVTNTDVETTTLRYRDGSGVLVTKKEPVFAPFVGTLTATLPAGATPLDTTGATVTTDRQGQTVLTWQLLLYPPMGSYQQVVRFAARVDEGAIPGVVFTATTAGSSQDPAVAFGDTLLGKTVTGNTKLADGIEQLNSSTAQLAQGAATLSDGVAQLAAGLDEASAGVTGKLAPGTTGVATGADALSVAVAELATGMATLADRDHGLPALRHAARLVLRGARQISAAVGSPDDPPPSPQDMTLVQGMRAAALAGAVVAQQTETLSTQLDQVATTVAALGGDAGTVGADAAAAATAVAQLAADLCPPPGPLTEQQCAALQGAHDDADAAATGAGTLSAELADASAASAAAASEAAQVAAIAAELDTGLAELRDAVEALATALSNDSATQPGLVQGLQLVVAGLDLAAPGATLLSDAAELTETGANTLATGAGQAASGTATLAAALSQLATGAGQAAGGSEKLAGGAETLQQDGTQKLLSSVVAASGEPALASAYLAAAQARAGSALPYGLPEGATGSAGYVMTMDPVEPEGTAGWQLAAIALVLAAGIVGAILKTWQGNRVG